MTNSERYDKSLFNAKYYINFPQNCIKLQLRDYSYNLVYTASSLCNATRK